MQKVSKEGIEAPLTQPQKTSDQPRSSESVEELMRGLDNPLVPEQEAIIRKKLAESAIRDPEQINKILTRYLAAYQIVYSFENLYNLIFGSQISALQHLNVGGETKETIKKLFYDPVATLLPEFFQKYPFEQYLNFLVSQKLITEKDSLYCITNLGREFLAYLAKTGKTQIKPG